MEKKTSFRCFKIYSPDNVIINSRNLKYLNFDTIPDKICTYNLISKGRTWSILVKRQIHVKALESNNLQNITAALVFLKSLFDSCILW